MLATRLQAKLAQHMAGLTSQQCPQLHLLHHMLGLETTARGSDGAALFQCITQLQPFSRSLSSSQRATVLGAIGNQHSGEVQEAATQLLLDSMLADEAASHASPPVPVFLQRMLLTAESQLRAIARCQTNLLGVPAHERSLCWMKRVQVIATTPFPVCMSGQNILHVCMFFLLQWLSAHAWNAGASLLQHSTVHGQAADLLLLGANLQANCQPSDDKQLISMQQALAAAHLNDVALPEEGGAARIKCSARESIFSGGTPAAGASQPGAPEAVAQTQDSKDTVAEAPQQKHLPDSVPLSSSDRPITAHAEEVAPTAAGTAQEGPPPKPVPAAMQSPITVGLVGVPSSAPAEEAARAGQGSWSDASDSGDDDDVPVQRSSWLQSMLAAHKRMLTNAQGRTAKRQALARPACQVSTTPGPYQKREQKTGEPQAGSADALSIEGSMPGGTPS